MDYTEIAKKLIGPITPMGDASRDPERFENLKAMCEMVNNLVGEIDYISHKYKNTYEHSVKEMADYADKFLTNELGITDDNSFQLLKELFEAINIADYDMKLCKKVMEHLRLK